MHVNRHVIGTDEAMSKANIIKEHFDEITDNFYHFIQSNKSEES